MERKSIQIKQPNFNMQKHSKNRNIVIAFVYDELTI